MKVVIDAPGIFRHRRLPLNRVKAAPNRRWPIDAIVLLTVQALSLIALQYTSASVLVKTNTIRYMPPGLYLRFLSEQPWQAIDLALTAIALLTFAAIIVVDLTRGSVTRFLHLVLAHDTSALLFTFGCCLVSVRYYFAPGRLTWGADASHHAVHTWIASEGIRSGTLPIWTPLLSVGSYFVQYYGFLFAYLSGAATAWFGDLDLGLKLTLGIVHAASGAAAFLYVRTLTGNRAAGFVAALAYVTTFWHTQLVLVMGRFTAGLVFALLPIPFYSIERLRRNGPGKRRHALIGSASIACLAYTHPGYAFWSVGFLLLYLITLSLRDRRRIPLQESAVLVCLGLAWSAYLILPMWLDQQWTGLGVGFSMTTQGKPSLGQLLSWSNYRARLTGIPDENHWFGGYVGLSLIALVVMGYLIRLRRFRFHAARDFPLIGLLLSLAITFGYELPVLRDLAVVQAMGAARYLVFSVFFLSVLAGTAVTKIRARYRRQTLCLTLIVAVILIDLGSTTFMQPHHFASDADATKLGPDLLTKLTEPRATTPYHLFVPERILHVSKPINSFLMMISRTPSVFGLFEEHPRADREFVRPFLEKLRGDMTGDRQAIAGYLDGPEGAIAMAGFRLLNTRHYIMSNGRVPTGHLDLEKVSPIAVSRRKSRFVHDGVFTPSATFAAIDRMGLDQTSERCYTILTREGDDVELPDDAGIELISHAVEIDRATIRFTTTADAFARLSYGYYPNLDLTLNGSEVDYFPTAEGFIGLDIPAGDNTIRITGRQSGLRTTIFWVDVILLVAALYWARQNRAKKRTRR